MVNNNCLCNITSGLDGINGTDGIDGIDGTNATCGDCSVSGVQTINNISSDGDFDFLLVAGDYITIEPITNGVMINATGTPFNVPNTLVARDSLGNFAASQINATDFAATGATATSVVLESLVTGDTYDRFYMTADGTMNWGNGSSPTDVNMFRSAPNTLTIDLGNMIITGYASAGIAVAPTNTFLGAVSGATFFASNISDESSSLSFSSQLTTDSFPEFTIDYAGAHLWGSGAAAQATRLWRTATSTLTFDNATTTGEGTFIVTGNHFTSHYAKVGGITTPINTAVGDITATRMMVGGTDYVLSAADGMFAKINGDIVGVNTGTIIGFNSTISVSPSATATGTYVGNHFATALSSNFPIVGPNGKLIGSRSIGQMGGSGDVDTAIGLFAGTAVITNRPGVTGLLNIGVTAGGISYTAEDVLSVIGGGGTGGTVIVNAVDGNGTVLSVRLDHPGTGYTVGAGLATTGGTGSGFTLDLITVSSTGYASNGELIGIQVQAYTSENTFATPAILGPMVGIQIIDSNLGSGPSRGSGAQFSQIGISILAQTMTTKNTGIEIKAFTAANATNKGIVINGFTGGGAGTGTATSTNTGIDIMAMTGAGTTNVGLKIETPSGATTNRAMQLGFVNAAQSTLPSGGILFGTGADSPLLANLYRTASGRLRTDGEFQANHYLCTTASPTLQSFGNGAGTGGTPTVTFGTGSNDAGMSITLVTGSAPAASTTIFIIQYASAYSSSATFVLSSPISVFASALTGIAKPWVSASTTTTFTFRSGATALAATTSYTWNFSVRA